MQRRNFLPLGYSTAVLISAFLFSDPSVVSAQDAELGRPGPDLSGGWIAYDRGFATREKIEPGETVNIRILSMGNALGIAVTYSGNLAESQPGKLWNTVTLRDQETLSYRVSASIGNRQLAVRSGARPNGLDKAVSVEQERGAYRLEYASGRVLLVSIGRHLPRPGRHNHDISGGWTVGNMGFASDSNISVRSAITLRVVNAGNDRGLAVTYSGNLNLHEPGKLWQQSEVQDGVTLLYQVPPVLANRQIAIRSGASPVGLDKPKSVEQRGNGYRLSYFGGRIVDVTISNPDRNLGPPGPGSVPGIGNAPGIGRPPTPGNVPGLSGLGPGSEPPRPEPGNGLNLRDPGGLPGLPPPAKGLDVLPSDE